MTYATDVAALTQAVRSLQSDVVALSRANAALTQAVINGGTITTGTGTTGSTTTTTTSLAALTTTGDIPYRMASGALGRWGLAGVANGAIATVVNGLPGWVVPALGGTVVAGATVPWGNVTAKPIFGNAALLDAAPGAGLASGVQVVTGADPRLGDSRSPTAHQHADAVAGGASGLMSGASLTALNNLLLTSGTASGGGVTTQPAGTNSTLPASTAFVQTALANVLTNPTLSGTVSVPTVVAGANNTQAASTAFVAAAVAKGKADLVGMAPGILDTFEEVAALLSLSSGDTLAVGFAMANRLRFDIATQALSATEQHNALTNLGIQDGPTQAQVLAILGYTPINKAGDTMTGSLVVAADATVNGALTVSGAATVGGRVRMTSSTSLKLPTGTTLQRPADAVFGDTRGNRDTNALEWFDGQYWYALGSAPAGSLFTIDYTITGAITTPITAIVTSSPPIFPNGVTADYSGVWAATLVIPATNVMLSGISFTNLQGLTGTLSLTAMSALASVSFPALTAVIGSVAFSSLSGLVSVSMPLLSQVGAGLTFSNCKAIPSIYLPAVYRVGADLTITGVDGATSISMPNLAYVGANLSLGELVGTVSLNMGGLVEVVGRINLYGIAALTTVALTSCEYVGRGLTGGAAITIGPLAAAVVNFSLSNSLKCVNGSIYIDCALGQPSVNGLLERLASLNGSNGTTLFANKSITFAGASAPPSGNGLTAMAALMGRGCTVVHN